MKFADKHKLSPGKRLFLVGAWGNGWRLVKTEASDVGGLDDVGVVVALLGESDRVVLNAVGLAEFHQILDEVAEVFDEVIITLVCFDVA